MSSDRARGGSTTVTFGERPHAVNPEDALSRIAALAQEFGGQQIAADARTSLERIAEGRFYVACVGQFKRGKSTLLNALLGTPILPSGITPVTAIPTVLRYGNTCGARVGSDFGTWLNVEIKQVEQFVSEEKNPQNKKAVSGVEVFVPSPLLSEGMCLVDTPGLGSVFAANTTATHAFIPHIDAAIVVIGADPPISGEELNLLESVSQQVPNLLFVLNKADRVTESERTAAISFAQEVIQKRLNCPIPAILEISALERLENRGSGRDWGALVRELEDWTRQSGRLVQDAARRSVRRLSFQLAIVLKEERDALIRPFDESEKRLKGLRELVSQAEQSLNDLAYLLSAEQQRLSKKLSDRKQSFLDSARQTAHQKLDSLLYKTRRGFGPTYRRAVMGSAQEVARDLVLPWLRTEKEFAEQAYAEIANRFTDLANDFLSRVRTMGSPELVPLPEKMNAQQSFQSRSKFQFYDFIEVAMPSSPLRYLGDAILGLIRSYSPAHTRAHEFLDRLLDTNSERVRNDLENRVAESRSKLEAKIQAMLRELSSIAERSLRHARAAHAAGSVAVEIAVRRLALLEAELSRLQQ
jgi:predicted GTPase